MNDEFKMDHMNDKKLMKNANIVTRIWINLEWMMLIELIRIDNIKHTLIWINRLKVLKLTAKSKLYWFRGGIKKIDGINIGKNLEKG